jgi:hypothetical protein
MIGHLTGKPFSCFCSIELTRGMHKAWFYRANLRVFQSGVEIRTESSFKGRPIRTMPNQRKSTPFNWPIKHDT